MGLRLGRFKFRRNTSYIFYILLFFYTIAWVKCSDKFKLPGIPNYQSPDMRFVQEISHNRPKTGLDEYFSNILEDYSRISDIRFSSLSINFNPYLPNKTSDLELYEKLAIYFSKVSERFVRISMRDEDFSSADFLGAPQALAKWNNINKGYHALHATLTFTAPIQSDLTSKENWKYFSKFMESVDLANEIYPKTVSLLQMSFSKDFNKMRLSHYFAVLQDWQSFSRESEGRVAFAVEFPIEFCSANLSEYNITTVKSDLLVSIKVVLDSNDIVNKKLSQTMETLGNISKPCEPIANTSIWANSTNIGLRETNGWRSKDDQDVLRFWKLMAVISEEKNSDVGMMNAFDKPSTITNQSEFGWWKMVKNKDSRTGLGYDFVKKLKDFCTEFSCTNGNCSTSQVPCVEDEEDLCMNNGFDQLCSEDNVEQGVSVFQVNDSNATIKPLESVQLSCNVPRHNDSVVIWRWENELISLSSWSMVYIYTLSDDNVTLSVQFQEEKVNGTFRCAVYHRTFGNNSAFINILVGGFVKPYFMATNLENSTKSWRTNEKLQLICVAAGHPKPRMTWEWMEEPSLNETYSLSMTFSLKQNNRSLLITNISTPVKVRFICTGENKIGKVVVFADVSLAEEEPSKILMISGIISGALLLFAVALVIIVCRYKQRKAEFFFGGMSLKEFYEGNIENINPELGVSDQASLLPFSQETWEISRDRLELGKALGSGAFGLVLKAEAYGVVDGEKSTAVAVKTVQPIADKSHYKALIMELKIMAHLGKHLNVVNLIGAVTKNLSTKKELYVVMEFCKYGSVLGYLHNNRDSFINQLDPKTDQIDPSIYTRAGQNNITLNNKYDKVQSSSTEEVADDTIDTSLPDYIGDYEKTEVQPLKSTDLLSWALQAAKGMEYLASRKVLHGDLAARNVLIAENHVIKICDFGFAREKNYDYQKHINGVLLPIKWMAIESINCGIFSPKSDCWSFGVLLWELFTLGDKPYPGVAINSDFVQRLKDGFRMEKPQYAPTSVYQIMLDCWSQEANNRPQFTEVADRLKELVSTSVYTTLEDLSEQYTCLNKEVNASHENDYFMNMGPAEFTAEVVGDDFTLDSNTDLKEEDPKSFLSTDDKCSISLNTKQVEYTSSKKGSAYH